MCGPQNRNGRILEEKPPSSSVLKDREEINSEQHTISMKSISRDEVKTLEFTAGLFCSSSLRFYKREKKVKQI
jgi:hypothetical protein